MQCFLDIIENTISKGKSYRNYLNLFAYSAKSLSNLGLKD
jgi:hypothetical protein